MNNLRIVLSVVTTLFILTMAQAQLGNHVETELTNLTGADVLAVQLEQKAVPVGFVKYYLFSRNGGEDFDTISNTNPGSTSMMFALPAVLRFQIRVDWIGNKRRIVFEREGEESASSGRTVHP